MSYIKNCYEKLSKLEDINEIYEMQIKDIDIWRTIRVEIGYKYYSKFSTTISTEKSKGINVTFLKDLYFAPKNKTIIFEANKKVKSSGKYIDPVTNKFNEKDTITVDTMKYSNKYYNLTRKSHYFSSLKGVINKFNKLKFSKEEIEKMTFLRKKINNIFGENFISQKELENTITRLILNVKYYEKVFQKIKPKKIIIAPSYLQIPVVIAANKLDIKSEEIQYALMSKYHIGYATNNKRKMSFYPTKLLVWSEYWNKDYLFNCEIEVYQNDIINIIKKPKKKQILVISQEVIWEKVLRFYEELVESNLDYEIILKKHPWDNNKYPEKINLLNKDIDLLQAINDSEIVITTFSTSFYEALYLNCKVFLIDDELNDVIDEEIQSIVIKNSEELEMKIKTYQFKIKTSIY